MRGMSLNSPISALFLYGLVFAMLARRGIHLATSAMVAWGFVLMVGYAVLALQESDRQEIPFARALHPLRWSQANRDRAKLLFCFITASALAVLLAGLFV